MLDLLPPLFSAMVVVSTVVFSMQVWSRLCPGSFLYPPDREMEFFFRTGVGAIILSIILFSFAGLHVFNVLNLKILAWVSAAGLFFQAGFYFRQRSKQIVFPGWSPASSAFGLCFLAVLVLTLIPADEKDELIYHLEIPRQMLMQGGWVWLPDNVYSFFPHFTELFFALGLALSGEVAARLFHAAFGLLLAATLYRYTRQYLDRFWAAAAVLIFITTPSVFLMMSWAYVDLTFTWFVLLAWIAAEKIGEPEYGIKRAVLAGLFCGATACIKYTGIQFTLLLCAVIFVRALFQKRGRAIMPLILILVLSMGAVFLPYLIRNVIATGWPLYPFHFLEIEIKKGLNWDAERARLYFDWIKTFGAPIQANHLLWNLFAPVRVFFDGEFNNSAKFDGVLGPVFLLLPVFYISGKMKRAPEQVAFFCVLYLYYWVMTTHQARFLIPMLPFASLLLAVGLSNLKRPVAIIILGSGLLFNLGIVSKEVIHKKPFQYLSGEESRELYLSRQHRVYAMYAATNRLLPKDARVYLLQMKNYGYYLNANWTADFLFERYQLEKLLNTQPKPEQVTDFFKTKQVTHLLVDQQALRSPETGLEVTLLGPFDQFLSKQGKLVAMKDGMMLYELNLTSPPRSV